MRAGAILLLSLGLAAAALAQKPAPSANPDDTEKKLEILRGEIKALAREQQALEEQRSAAARELREMDGQVAGSAGALRRIEADLEERGRRLRQLDQERQAKDEAIARQREELARLLRSSYALGRDGELKRLLSQDRPGLQPRLQAYHRYFEADRQRRIEQIHAESEALATLSARIQTEKEALLARKQAQDSALSELQAQRARRDQRVQGLDARYRSRESRLKALGRDEKALQALLEKLRAAIARAPAVVPARPRTPVGKPITARAITGWPLAGSLLAAYGNALPDGRRSEGLLIAAEAGSSVRAVAAGRVVYADWLKGYGLLLIVDHGEGWMSLYAYNDALLKNAGDSVAAGEAVAAVGNSGGQGRPALYFEMRRNGQPQKPDGWLKP